MTDAVTQSMRDAYEWLRKRGGDGAFTKNGLAVLAHGEISRSHGRKTWNLLRGAGVVQYYGGKSDGGTGHGRIKVIACLP